MNPSMFFSVIIPLYNKAPYVRKAIESVVGQTYSGWELIVVDNGSTDGSGAIVASFQDSRIRMIRLDENIGPGAARNRGVKEVGGCGGVGCPVKDSPSSWICFLDADDWWEPTFLEEMAGLIGRHPGAGIYGTGYWMVKNGRKRLAPIGVDENFTEGEINYCQVYAKTLCMPLTSISVAMPRSVFEECGGFKPHLRLGEDFDLWIRIALKYKVVLLNKPLSNYNQDVDIAYRGTHHLRAPEEHMLWNLGYLESFEKTNTDYKQLIDNLRTYSLHLYLIDGRYRDAARKELSKVDWSRQPEKVRRLYQHPIWYLSLRMHWLKFGAKIKQTLLQHV